MLFLLFCCYFVIVLGKDIFLNSDILRYTQNGILHMLDRNRRIKARPERFQDSKESFDLVITAEERVYDQVIESKKLLFCLCNSEDLKQARTTRAGNKQLNFSVKKKPLTTYCIFAGPLMKPSCLWSENPDFHVDLNHLGGSRESWDPVIASSIRSRRPWNCIFSLGQWTIYIYIVSLSFTTKNFRPFFYKLYYYLTA